MFHTIYIIIIQNKRNKILVEYKVTNVWLSTVLKKN